MKYKAGDKVRIKSHDWYNENKDKYGAIYAGCGFVFWNYMAGFCGEIMTIASVKVDPENPNNGYYFMENNKEHWTDEMIEGLVEEETKFGTASNPIEPKSNANCLTLERVDALATKIDKELPSWNQNVWELPNGYQFTDENGNIINATKIVLEKKKKEYPKTFEECVHVLEGENRMSLEQMNTFRKLIDARNAYWKLAGEEMGLGKPWEPDWKNSEERRYSIVNIEGDINLPEKTLTKWILKVTNKILVFPTEEMRDAFYENFKELIEQCKELL